MKVPHWVQVDKARPVVYGNQIDIAKSIRHNSKNTNIWVNIGNSPGRLPIQPATLTHNITFDVHRNAIDLFENILSFDVGTRGGRREYVSNSTGTHLETTYDGVALHSKKYFQSPYQGCSIFASTGSVLQYSLCPTNQNQTKVFLGYTHIDIEALLDSRGYSPLSAAYINDMTLHFPEILEYFRHARALEHSLVALK